MRFAASSLGRVALALLTFVFPAVTANAQKPPLVYDKENTGAIFPKPIFPPSDQLPSIHSLPDPFSFFDGTNRNTSLAEL